MLQRLAGSLHLLMKSIDFSLMFEHGNAIFFHPIVKGERCLYMTSISENTKIACLYWYA